jgi:hypothetical protein
MGALMESKKTLLLNASYNKNAKKTPLLAAGMNWQTEKEHLTNLKYDSILYVMTSLKEWIDELSKFFSLLRNMNS